MKILIGLMATLILAACQDEVPIIKVYDEITHSPESMDYPATGAKLYLLKDASVFSTVRIQSFEHGKMTELAEHDLEGKAGGRCALSLRVFIGAHNKLTWGFRYRGDGNSSIPIYGTEVEDGWHISGLKSSRHGRLDEQVEILDKFFLFRDVTDHDLQDQLSVGDLESLADYQAFSKKHPQIKIILLTLE